MVHGGRDRDHHSPRGTSRRRRLTTRPDRPYPPAGVESPARGEGDDLTDAGVKPLAHPVRPGPGGGHARPDGAGHPRRPPRAAPPHPPRTEPLGQPWVGVAATPHRRFPAARPRAAEARGYGGVEDPPRPLDAALACAALTVVTSLAVPRRERRLTRLFRAQQEWAERRDRRG
ncbi:MAG: hypothetical protein JOZ53_24175 [Planctomycetaceae bacterium]|nr:hypothetical protein [Planctomycetaceae bacterium]